ncbi:hypothetical protein D0865_13885 [Hortaea werneckii]|uniref:DUF1907 domain-containing protein n=1 Tax=Hortaea werneckii TaxID=91943 RepID=A0A3M7B712_HORWE|nr:hypothetical protein D0865_13885 [Hortaea werneckii]
MKTEKYPLSPPSLDELAKVLEGPLGRNYDQSSISVVPCPDLRRAPFFLATEGLSGSECAADVGGQPNIFPRPRLDCQYSMLEIIQSMEMGDDRGSLIGAGAGPFHVLGVNSELAPNLSWLSLDNIDDQTYGATLNDQGKPRVTMSPHMACGFMMNLFGCQGVPGPVLKIVARGRIGQEKSFTQCIRKAMESAFPGQTVTLGGAFLIKSGRSRYHIMPAFPPETELPFKDPKALNDWLTYHDIDGSLTCVTVLHSTDPDHSMGLRLEHTHSFSPDRENAGGHYHYDIESRDADTVEYEAYFNTAKIIYRIDRPEVHLERDLHD